MIIQDLKSYSLNDGKFHHAEIVPCVSTAGDDPQIFIRYFAPSGGFLFSDVYYLRDDEDLAETLKDFFHGLVDPLSRYTRVWGHYPVTLINMHGAKTTLEPNGKTRLSEREPDPDPYDMRIADLRSWLAGLTPQTSPAYVKIRMRPVGQVYNLEITVIYVRKNLDMFFLNFVDFGTAVEILNLFVARYTLVPLSLHSFPVVIVGAGGFKTIYPPSRLLHKCAISDHRRVMFSTPVEVDRHDKRTWVSEWKDGKSIHNPIEPADLYPTIDRIAKYMVLVAVEYSYGHVYAFYSTLAELD